MSENTWYDDGLRFTCTQCGNCCTGPTGYVWFNDAEAQAIADHLKLTLVEFLRRFAHRTSSHGAPGGDGQMRWSLNEVQSSHGYDCVFLRRDPEGKALCSIYPVRPTQCKTWPFWPENLVSRKRWEEIARRCPGMAKGGTPEKAGEGNFYPIEKIRILRERKSYE